MSIFFKHHDEEFDKRIGNFAEKIKKSAKNFLTTTKNFSKENFSNEKELKDLIKTNYSGFKTSISLNKIEEKKVVILTIFFSEIVKDENRKRLIKDLKKGLKKHGISLKCYKDYAVDVKIPFSAVNI